LVGFVDIFNNIRKLKRKIFSVEHAQLHDNHLYEHCDTIVGYKF